MELSVRVTQHIIEAGRAIMHSDFVSLQAYDKERHALRLITHYGFDASSTEGWAWVFPDSRTTCGETLRTGKRVIVQDIETCDFLALWREAYHRCGIRSVQSTPLVTPDGQLIGMVSTHWRTPYQPTSHELNVFDVWARQTADAFIDNKELTQLLKEVNLRVCESNKQVERCRVLVKQLEHELTLARQVGRRSPPHGYVH